MKAMIETGAAGVHFEDQLSSAKKCGHLGGKVVVPTREFIEKLTAGKPFIGFQTGDEIGAQLRVLELLQRTIKSQVQTRRSRLTSAKGLT